LKHIRPYKNKTNYDYGDILVLREGKVSSTRMFFNPCISTGVKFLGEIFLPSSHST
jgi:ketosteroid isomerase-like protein